MKTCVKEESLIITISWLAYYFAYFADKGHSSILLLLAVLFPVSFLMKRRVKLFSAISIVAFATSLLQFIFVKVTKFTATDAYVINILVCLIFVLVVSSINGLMHVRNLKMNARNKRSYVKLARLYVNMCWQYALILSILMILTVSVYSKSNVSFFSICMIDVVPTMLAGIAYLLYKIQPILFMACRKWFRQYNPVKKHVVKNLIGR